MKRIISLIAMLALLGALCACGKDTATGTQPAGQPTRATLPPTVATTPEPTRDTTEAATQEATQTPTESPTEGETQAPTEAVSVGIDYHEVEPYTLPVANVDKEIYDQPEGTCVGTFGEMGYFTIVAEAKDSEDNTWGKLKSGAGWTMVYQQILPELDMVFCTGVGAWATQLSLYGNGRFEGEFHDSDMGDTGPDYPNGTHYYCNFGGYLSVTDLYEDRVHLTMHGMTTDEEAGTIHIEDGVQLVAVGPYGMEGGTEFILYYPNTPVSQLSEDVIRWARWDLGDTLGRYALYNVSTGTTFFS